MNNKLLLAGLIFFLSIGIVFFVRVNLNSDVTVKVGNAVNNENEDLGKVQDVQSQTDQNSSDLESQQNIQTQIESNRAPPAINEQVLSDHNSRESCWVVYDDKVYDVTSYLSKHPGGRDRILRYCGDLGFQNAFENQHGTSQVSRLMSVGTFMGDFSIVGGIN